jgi:hypothetical protein
MKVEKLAHKLQLSNIIGRYNLSFTVGSLILVSILSTATLAQSAAALVNEKINVRARTIHAILPPPIGSVTAYHLFIVYTEKHGIQFICQGFPFDPKTGQVAPDAILPANPPGLLTQGRCISYLPGNRDFIPDAPTITVVSGQKANLAFHCFVKETALFNISKVPYHLIKGPNSNSYTRTMLDQCNVPALKPSIATLTPGWDISIDLAHIFTNSRSIF